MVKFISENFLLRHGNKGQPTSKVTQSRSNKDEARSEMDMKLSREHLA